MLLQAKKSGNVTFICEVGSASQEIYLAGSFNHWRPDQWKMRKAKDGSFRMQMQLDPGRYQYMYVVDGVWHNDPDAPQQQLSPTGTLNSAFVVATNIQAADLSPMAHILTKRRKVKHYEGHD
jgi:hypothetical protein